MKLDPRQIFVFCSEPVLRSAAPSESRRSACQTAIWPSPNSPADDVSDIAAGEILAMTLAGEAGIMLSDHRLVALKGRSVSVITRFDRHGGHRIPLFQRMASWADA